MYSENNQVHNRKLHRVTQRLDKNLTLSQFPMDKVVFMVVSVSKYGGGGEGPRCAGIKLFNYTNRG